MALQAGVDRAVEFAAYLVSGVIAFVWGIMETLSGLGSAIECAVNQSCFGTTFGYFWSDLIGTIIPGLVLLLVAGFLFFRARRARVAVILIPPATAPPSEPG